MVGQWARSLGLDRGYMTAPSVYNPQRDVWNAIRSSYYRVELMVIEWICTAGRCHPAS